MLHIISDFTAKSLLTPLCLQIRILQIERIQLGEWGWEKYESGLNIICTAPEKVTKSFELTEKMRKLIEKLLVYLYTFKKLIMLSGAGCALNKHDTVSYAEKGRKR